MIIFMFNKIPVTITTLAEEVYSDDAVVKSKVENVLINMSKNYEIFPTDYLMHMGMEGKVFERLQELFPGEIEFVRYVRE